MIDVALVRLVGSGLTLLAEGYGEAVPPQAVESGYQLVSFLAKEGRELDLVGFVGSVVGDIWQRWSEARLPPGVALAHIEALPGIMDRFRPHDGFLTSMIVSALSSSRQGHAASDQSRRVTEVIIDRARAAGAIGDQGLNEPILHFFLERLLARLFADLATVAQMRPLLQRYLVEGLWREAQALPQPSDSNAITAGTETASPPTVEPESTAASGAPAMPAALALEEQAERHPLEAAIAEMAARHGVPAKALAALLPRETGGAAPDIMLALMTEHAEGLMRLLADFAAAEPALLPQARELVQQFRGEIAEGAFDAAGLILGQIEDIQVRAAQTDLPAAHALLGSAASMRAARAGIDMLQGGWRRAARCLGLAVRCLDPSDRLGRWRYHMRQAEALIQAGRDPADHAALIEAVQVYATAAGMLSEQSAPHEWANTNLSLGNLLLTLAEKEGRSDRLRAAALHFKPAVDVFSKLKAAEEWAAAQLGLARALQGQGMIQGDVVTLGEAAFACRAVLGIATPDRMPEEWAGALTLLAATLIRIGEETGDGRCYADAAAAFRKLLAAPSGAGRLYDALNVKLRLGDVLLAAASHSQDAALLEEAVVLYRDLIGGSRETPPAAAARACSALGTALWALGERANDVAQLSDAARAKLDALDRYEAAGAEAEASRVRNELAALEQAIAAVTKAAAIPHAEAAE